MQLDDIEARAKLAAAESAVKSAQAALEAATQNGTLEQRQAAAAEIARNKLERDQAQHDLDALQKLSSTGAASASEVAAARQRLATAEANLHAAEQSSQEPLLAGGIGEGAGGAAGCGGEPAGSAAGAGADFGATRRKRARFTASNVKATEFVEQGKMLLQMADLRQERVRAYFDEPEIGRLAVGQPILIKWDAKPGKVWHGTSNARLSR